MGQETFLLSEDNLWDSLYRYVEGAWCGKNIKDYTKILESREFDDHVKGLVKTIVIFLLN